MTTFSDLNINKPLINALNDIGFFTPTPIQEEAFSTIMSGKDVLGIAQTGTGKTFAYLLPCLRQWTFTGSGNPQIMILVPTRELVIQVVEEVEKLTKYMNVVVKGVYGGVNINTQSEYVYSGMDVVVATPGRLYDLVLKGVIKLKSIKKLVVDEVDEMLNLGFRHQLTSIFDLLPAKRQNILFSATMTKEISILIKSYFNDPIKIQIAETGTPLDNISQKGFLVPNFNTKLNLLDLILSEPEMKKVLVFASTKKIADKLFARIDENFPTESGIIHSNKAQNNRFKTVKHFHEGDYRILIATDVLSRGMDISDISHVINFDMPDFPEDYMHRIGRTGRAEKEGIAITFILEKDAEVHSNIEKLMGIKIPIIDLPENLIISKILTADEKPKTNMKNIVVKKAKDESAGAAFHEKIDKNKKVNNKIRRKEKMNNKYGKPISRGIKKSNR